MSRKPHPLEIRTLGDDSGDVSTYYSKGHHEFAAFLTLVASEHQEIEGLFVPDGVGPFHEWGRFVPSSDWSDYDYQFMPVDGPGARGVFPLTMYTIC